MEWNKTFKCSGSEKFALLPVIIHKGGFGAVHQREGVVGGLVPLNAIYAVSPVVIAGDDNAADELFGAFVVEVLLAFLEKQIPGENKHKNKHTTGTLHTVHEKNILQVIK